MREVEIDGTDFQGRTSPRPWRLPTVPLECRQCGSSLAGRRQAVRWSTVGGVRFMVDVFRCGCGRGRQVRREVAAGLLLRS